MNIIYPLLIALDNKHKNNKTQNKSQLKNRRRRRTKTGLKTTLNIDNRTKQTNRSSASRNK